MEDFMVFLLLNFYRTTVNPNIETQKIQIFDMRGFSVYVDYNVELNHYKLDLSFLRPGIYFYKIVTTDNIEFKGKIIKQ